MKTTPALTVPARSTALATFGHSHGYRFDADMVALTASFHVRTPAAHQRAWALQLWACATAPTKPEELQGQLIATASLPPLAEVADPVETFTVSTTAVLPVGQHDHALVLALVALNAESLTEGEIHDLAAYPCRETFLLPRLLDGKISGLSADHVVITAGSIENPRDAANNSGTLSLELWAMDQVYDGGDFTGSPVAGVVLGTLAGQSRWIDLRFSLTADLPPKNSSLVLMLREWNGSSYITRDYVTISEPVIVPAAAEPATPMPANVVTKPGKETKKSSRTATVSINKAAGEEFAAVKGLSPTLVQAIIAGRPYARLDDLAKVKGIGPKLLTKIRSRLRLN